MVHVKKKLALVLAFLLTVAAIPLAAKEVKAAANVNVTSSVNGQTEVQKGDILSVTYTYTSDSPNVTVLQGILTWDESVLERQGEAVPSDNLQNSGGWLGESSGNTVNALIVSGGYLPASASVTYQFKVLADCTKPASEISMKMTVAVNTASERYENTVKDAVVFGHPSESLTVDRQEVSCTEDGHEKITCGVCHTVLKDETTAALGHMEGEWITTEEGNCLTAQKQELRCSRCGVLLGSRDIPAVGKHTWVTDDTTDAEGWKITKEVSVTEEGTLERVCSICGEKETSSILMSVHSTGDVLVEKGEIFSVTYTYTAASPEVIVLQGILDWDQNILERQGEPVVSDNLKDAYLGEAGGNTVNAMLLTGEYLPQTASITYQFKALADYTMDPAVIQMKLTLGIHKTSERYTETVSNNVVSAYPLQVGEIFNRQNTEADLTMTVPDTGTVFYLVQDEDMEMPDAGLIQKTGSQISITAGENQVTLEGLPEDAAVIYLLAVNQAGRVSKIAAVNLEAYAILGDVDWDGDIDIFDASAVIDMIYGRTELDKKHADVNRDGVVDVFDASTVVDMIYGRI